MDNGFSELDGQLYERVSSFARTHLAKPVQPTPAAFREAIQKMGEMGLCGLCISEDFGGTGLGAKSTSVALEALGRECPDGGLWFSVGAHLLACALPVAEFAGESVKRKLLPKLASGEYLGANAATEAEAGSDIFALRTSAVREGESYVLNGAKSYVTNGPASDVMVVYAATRPSDGFMGLSAFAVESRLPGIRFGAPIELVGLDSAPMSSVYFEDCRVPAECILGQEGQGGLIFSRSMLWERACLFAGYLGAMERQLGQVVTYAKERRQAGHAIGKYQAVSHRIADMKIRLESARLLLYRACEKLDQNAPDAALSVAMSKVAVSEAAVQSGLDAVQIFGGLGLSAEMGVERQLRDALPSTIVSGTSEIQRNLIAKLLGL